MKYPWKYTAADRPWPPLKESFFVGTYEMI